MLPVQIKNVQHVPSIPHTLISPLQLEARMALLSSGALAMVLSSIKDHTYAYTICHGRHIILLIYLNLIGPSASPLSSVSTALLTVDLIHDQLGHACKTMPTRSSLTVQSDYSALSARAAPHQKKPTPPVACMQLPGEIISANLLMTKLPSIGANVSMASHPAH